MEQTNSTASPHPQAIVVSAQSRSSRAGTKLWWLTAICLLTSIGLSWWSLKPQGPTITIQFKEGHGIQVGNRLQHHGIEVGEVTAVTLTPQADGVVVKVRLHPQATRLATTGSQFWIVRPRLSLTKISGLDTVVGAKYLGVQPGPDHGELVTQFVGLETPLSFTDSEATEIELRFKEGNGLSIGDSIKHRGIVVGEVSSVTLNQGFSGVIVKARLLSGAENMARSGSLFWVERPTINASEIRGLDTLLSGRFIAVHPGSKDAPPQTVFEGLEQAPPADVPEGGVEIVLEALRRGGLQRGVPVMYRGMRIGHVISVGLARDAATVEARTWIDGAYKDLIRDNSRFWMNDGFDVSIGLKGVKLSTDTLSNLVIGGVSLATPPQPGASIKTGQRFRCADKPEDEWLQWQPRLPVGAAAVLPKGTLPQPVRTTLRWYERRFGFKREQQLDGWGLWLQGGRLLVPSNLVNKPAKAIDVMPLEAGGESWTIGKSNVSLLGSLSFVSLDRVEPNEPAGWSPARLKHVVDPIDVLVVTASSEVPITIAAARLKPIDVGHWSIDPSVPLTASHHGACVIDPSDGSVIGLAITVSDESKTVPAIGLWPQQ